MYTILSGLALIEPCFTRLFLTIVMAGLGPAIHVFVASPGKSWMPGPSPGMT